MRDQGRAATHRNQHRNRPLPQSGTCRQRNACQYNQPGGHHWAGLSARDSGAQGAALGRRHGPATGQHRGDPAGNDRDQDSRDPVDPARTEHRKRQPLQRDHQHDSRHPEWPGRPVAHHRERTLRRAVAAQPVGSIGNAVDVQAAGGDQQCRHCEQSGQRAGRAEGQRTRPGDGRGQSAQRGADHRQRGHRAAAHGSTPGTRDRHDRFEGESRCQRTHHDGDQVDGPATPASENVAIDDSAATAARSTGSARVAPVPSPSRMRRSRIGSKPSSARASA